MGGSHRRHRDRGGPAYCEACRKVLHRTRAAAVLVVRELERSGRAAEHPRCNEVLAAYPCPRGRGWHVGHSGVLKPWLRRRRA